MENRAKLKVFTAMVIYGTIALFVQPIALPSAVIAMLRAAIGAAVLLAAMAIRHRRLDRASIQSNGKLLLLSGAMLGFNWILLFEAYRYTTVATATLCYYTAPIWMIAASPFVFGEKMTAKKSICVAVALVGMVFVSGVAENGIPQIGEMRGVLLGAASAVLYAAIVCCNKRMRDISPYDKTFAQLAISACILLVYNGVIGNFVPTEITAVMVICMLVLGVVHTGIAYLLYFGSVADLPAQTVAILGYIDPVVAVLLSALVLKEPLSVYTAVGAVCIIGAAIVSELPGRKKNLDA